jgi:hypothetical protein
MCSNIEVYVFIMNCCKERRGLDRIEVWYETEVPRENHQPAVS